MSLKYLTLVIWMLVTSTLAQTVKPQRKWDEIEMFFFLFLKMTKTFFRNKPFDLKFAKLRKIFPVLSFWMTLMIHWLLLCVRIRSGLGQVDHLPRELHLRPVRRVCVPAEPARAELQRRWPLGSGSSLTGQLYELPAKAWISPYFSCDVQQCLDVQSGCFWFFSSDHISDLCMHLPPLNF